MAGKVKVWPIILAAGAAIVIVILASKFIKKATTTGVAGSLPASSSTPGAKVLSIAMKNVTDVDVTRLQKFLNDLQYWQAYNGNFSAPQVLEDGRFTAEVEAALRYYFGASSISVPVLNTEIARLNQTGTY